jgi:hypothetical protein
MGSTYVLRWQTYLLFFDFFTPRIVFRVILHLHPFLLCLWLEFVFCAVWIKIKKTTQHHTVETVSKSNTSIMIYFQFIIINYHPKYWHQRFVGTTNAEYAKLNRFYTIKEYPETEITSKQSMANANTKACIKKLRCYIFCPVYKYICEVLNHHMQW